MPGLATVEIRRAAVEFARRGWPVRPGTYPAECGTTWLGRLGAWRLEPLAEYACRTAFVDPTQALGIWATAPYSILIECGGLLDAVEVSARHGRRALSVLRGTRSLGPVVRTPLGRWQFLIRPNRPLRPELAAATDITLITAGSWLPLPPTCHDCAPVRWCTTPEAVGWRLPRSGDVQKVLLSTMV